MIVKFKETGSKKLLTTLNLNILLTIQNYVHLNKKQYQVTSVVFDANEISYTIWLKKLK